MKQVKPIFILSLPRSGSTLLNRLLVSPQYWISLEPWIMLPLTYINNSECVDACYSHSATSRAIDDIKKSMSSINDDWDHHIRNFAEGIYNSLSKLKDGNIEYFIDKTPRYHLIADDLARIFPNARFIILTRNPLSCLASGIDTWGGGKMKLHGQMIDLIDGPGNLANALTKNKDRAIHIKYEDIVSDTEGSLKGVYEFLGLPYDEDKLRDQSELNGSMGDPKEYTTSKIRSNANDKIRRTLGTYYRKRFARKYIESLNSNDLSTLGYETTDLLQSISSLPNSARWIMSDMITHAIATIWRIFDIGLLRKRLMMIKMKKSFTSTTSHSCIRHNNRRTMQLLNRTRSNVTWVVLSDFLTKATTLLTTIILARQLGVESFGIFSLSVVIASTLWPITDLGVNGYGIRRVARDKSHAEESLSDLNSARFVASIFISLVTIAVLYISGIEQEKFYPISLGLIYLLAYATNPDWLFRGIEDMKSLFFINASISISYLTTILLLISSPDDTSLSSFLRASSFFIGTLIGLYLLNKTIRSHSV